ncbi:MAG: ribosome maturation factor RimM [Bacteroidetes bacterium]|nr:ribosome maturation factor RimM [Bacteroidota bacterium]
MEKKDFFFLGKVAKTSGYKGSLVFFFDVDDIDNYKDLEAVFIETGGELIPFAIRNLQYKSGQTFFATLEEVDSDEQAMALIGSNLYLPLSFLPKLEGNQFYYHEVIGFNANDKKRGNIGIIESVMDQGKQALFSIQYEGKEILVPVSDHIIIKVDRSSKTIYLDCPEGLIDVYL